MLRNFLSGGLTAEKFISLGLYLIVILISLSVHELCHGYAAYRCGDATARNLGRLTLNPLAHLDPIGTLMMLVFGFGYAKPVPINTRNFNHYKRDLCIVSFAGPFSNLFLSFLGALLYGISFFFLPLFKGAIPVPFYYWISFCEFFIVANASLAVFNILPIPPLDGSRILSTVLPGKIAFYYLKYERVIMIIVMALLWYGILDGILSFFTGYVIGGVSWLADLILSPFIKLLG